MPSYAIDASGSQNRAMSWLCFLYGASGELYGRRRDRGGQLTHGQRVGDIGGDGGGVQVGGDLGERCSVHVGQHQAGTGRGQAYGQRVPEARSCRRRRRVPARRPVGRGCGRRCCAAG